MQQVKDKLRRVKIRLLSWEYWPMWVVYAPLAFYYVYLSIRARSLLFFSASNPSIDFGGMCFERKSKIYDIIPPAYYPPTFLIYPAMDRATITKLLDQHGIQFPLIAKPDIGGKGWGVKKIRTLDELLAYQSVSGVEFLVQAWVDFTMELSVFYCRYPSWEKGIITSVTGKTLLSITGDGIHTIEELIRQDDRAFLQLEVIRKEKRVTLESVLAKGEKITLVPYGNHARGTLFNDCHQWINKELEDTIDGLSKRIDGFYFGRFDILTTSLEDLYNGKNISIVELNGCGAEPIHIYHPGFPFFKAQRVIWQHFKMMFDIALENKKRGVAFIRPSDYIRGWKLQKDYKQKAPAEKLLTSHLQQINRQ